VAKRILLADDSLTIQKVVELTFSDSEYDLVCVSNGQRALDKVAENPPDLILADVVMPEKNGYEICEAIKANPATARIPVMLLSGAFEPFDRERAERLGCDAIVSKPFDSQQLLRQVEALLSRDYDDDDSSSATVAIPTMPNPLPPPPSVTSDRPTVEAGFATDDFTGRIRVPAGIAGGPDLFEEEYGQGDVESAIAAFEKAHPEFAYVDDGAADGAMTPAPSADGGNGEDGEHLELGEETGSPRDKLSGWLREEREPAPGPPVFPTPAPAPFWVPRQPEPELTPIPFAADDTGSRREEAPPEVPVLRADEAPTQQIRLSADFASLQRAPGPPDGDRVTDETTLPPPEERTAEISISEALFAAPAPAPPAEAEESAPVSREIEVLAQTTSIGQLKEMLSSVSRGEGSLSDDEIDRLASRVVERLSEKIVREIAWEVIPDVAELVIKQRIKELEAGVE
jgi:CheY-like chemotaxis protein